jgi:hypothetical protein
MSTGTGTPHEAILDDLPALLTGELSPHREHEVAAHLEGCDDCRRELAVIARASAWLQDAARLAPDAMVENRGPAEPLVLPPLQLPPHSRRPPTRWLAAAAAVVLLAAGVLGGVLLGRTRSGDSTSTRAVALHPVPGGVPVGDVVGEARLAADGGMRLSVNGLPRPPGRDFYEIWLFDPPSGRMLAVGVLPPDGKGAYSLPPTAEQGYTAVEISLEPDDGNPGHSKLSVLRGLIS